MASHVIALRCSGYLWPETSIEAVLACKDFKAPARSVEKAAAEDVDALWTEDGGQGTVDAATMAAAAEFMGSKSTASFGKALKTQMHERHFKASDGSVWAFKNLAGSNPRRLLVEKVRDAEE